MRDNAKLGAAAVLIIAGFLLLMAMEASNSCRELGGGFGTVVIAGCLMGSLMLVVITFKKRQPTTSTGSFIRLAVGSGWAVTAILAFILYGFCLTLKVPF